MACDREKGGASERKSPLTSRHKATADERWADGAARDLIFCRRGFVRAAGIREAVYGGSAVRPE